MAKVLLETQFFEKTGFLTLVFLAKVLLETQFFEKTGFLTLVLIKISENRITDVFIDVQKNNFQKPDRFPKPVRFGV